MNVLHELRKLGHGQPAKGPPIPIALPSLGQIGHLEHRRGLYLNSALEKHVRALLRDAERAERAALELTGGVCSADQLLELARLGSDSTDAIRAIKDVSAALTKWDDVQTAINSGKHWEYIGTKASQTTVANQWFSFLRTAGNPGAISFSNKPGPPALDSNTVGAWPLPMQLGVSDNLYLTNIGLNHATGTNIVLAVDVLIGVGNIFLDTTLQAVSSTSLPRWTGGAGLQMALEVTGSPSAGVDGGLGITYVNQSGSLNSINTSSTVPGTAAMIHPVGAPFVTLSSGDYGVRSIRDVTSGNNLSTIVAALIYKPLVALPMISTLAWSDRRDNVQIGGIRQLTEVAQGSKPCIGFLVFTSATSTGIQTYMIETVWG